MVFPFKPRITMFKVENLEFYEASIFNHRWHEAGWTGHEQPAMLTVKTLIPPKLEKGKWEHHQRDGGYIKSHSLEKCMTHDITPIWGGCVTRPSPRAIGNLSQPESQWASVAHQTKTPQKTQKWSISHLNNEKKMLWNPTKRSISHLC